MASQARTATISTRATIVRIGLVVRIPAAPVSRKGPRVVGLNPQVGAVGDEFIDNLVPCRAGAKRLRGVPKNVDAAGFHPSVALR